MNYLHFNLRIYPQHALPEPHAYQMTIDDSPTGKMGGVFIMPFDAEGLRRLRAWAERVVGRRLAQTAVGSTEHVAAQEMRDIGTQLFRTLPEEVRIRLLDSLSIAAQAGQGLLITLDLQEAPALVPVPWEYLFIPSLDRFLALSPATPLVRQFGQLAARRARRDAPGPLRVLVAAAAEAEAEVTRIRQSLESWAGSVELTILEQASLRRLAEALRNQPYHVLHVIGHGEFDEATNTGYLLLQREGQSESERVSGERLRPLLDDAPTLQAVVLGTCHVGLAPALLKAGVPHVIAMQFAISAPAAQAFARGFYGALAQGEPVPAAVAEGRRAIYVEQDNVTEWATPVVYTQAEYVRPPVAWYEGLEDRLYHRLTHISPAAFLALLRVLALLLLTHLLFLPVFAYPASGPNSAGLTAISLGLGTAVVPLLIALLLPSVELTRRFKAPDGPTRAYLYLLRYTGAYLGFFVGLGLSFLLVVVPLHYLALGTWLPSGTPAILASGALCFSLLFGYLGSKRVPLSMKAAHRSFFPTRSDIFIVLGLPLIVSPSLALFFYLWRDTLLDPVAGGLALAVALLFVVLWERRRAHQS